MHKESDINAVNTVNVFFNTDPDLLLQRVGIMVASHNEDTVRYAISRMEDLDIRPEDKVSSCVSKALVNSRLDEG